MPFGVTHFKVKTEGPVGEETPEGGAVTHIRTDVAPGLATNPTAVEQCSKKAFGEEEVAPGSGIFPPPACPEKVPGKPGSIIGTNKVTVYVEAIKKDVPLEGTVYNLVPDEGHASEFGVALNLSPLLGPGAFAHTFIKGSVEWEGQRARAGSAEHGNAPGRLSRLLRNRGLPGLPPDQLAACLLR